MGGGRWTTESFVNYSKTKGRKVDKRGSLAGDYHAQDLYKNRELSEVLNPKSVVRECCDSDEHPNTIPVMLALDVTGSMGASAVEFAKKINIVMTKLLKERDDVEFMICGIGDFKYDKAPFQAGQFESDTRIAAQLDELYFEGGGGGNSFESYTAAWYFGAYQTNLDCWKRGKKGIIITIGDEILNPYIPIKGNFVNFNAYMGSSHQGDILTDELYEEVIKKYDLYHMVADHSTFSHRRVKENVESFAEVIGEQNVSVVTVDTIADKIIEIVTEASKLQQQGCQTPPETVGWCQWDGARHPKRHQRQWDGVRHPQKKKQKNQIKRLKKENGVSLLFPGRVQGVWHRKGCQTPKGTPGYRKRCQTPCGDTLRRDTLWKRGRGHD